MKKRKQKDNFNKSKWVIFLPLILVMVLDLTFTIMGQPQDYWIDHTYFSESNPIGQIILSAGPLYFIAVAIIYLIGVLFIIIKLSKPINIMVYLGFFIGHIWGGASWLPEISIKYFNLEISEFSSGIVYFIIISIISGLCFNQINEQKSLLRKQ